MPGLAVNSELVLHEELRAVGGWRGPHACQRGAQEFDIAGRVIEEMWKLAQALLLLLLFLSLIEVMWKVAQGASRGWFHHRNHPHCITVTLTIVTVIMNEQEAHASEDMMDSQPMPSVVT